MTPYTLAFDELLIMAQDPERLETYRQQEVLSIIEQAPESMRRRLQGLQFQIDAHRTLHNDSPVGACIQLSKMMHESFNKLQTYLTQAAKEVSALQHSNPEKERQPASTLSAKVIRLPLKCTQQSP